MYGLEALPRTLEAALRDAKNAKESVRVAAVRDLSRHAAGAEGRQAVEALTFALKDDGSVEVRAAAALALADAGARDAVDALLGGTADPNLRVRQMSLIAIGELGDGADGRVENVIRAAIGDSAAALRYQGLIAANALSLPFAEAALVEATGDADGEVRYIALRLLEERASAEKSGQPADSTLTVVALRLSDPALRVRLAAGLFFGRMGDRAGAEAITEGIEARDDTLDPEDVQAAIVLAGELAVHDAAAALARHAWGTFGRGSRFAYEARIALANMGNIRAKKALLQGLSASSRDARTLAVVAAGRANLSEALPLIEAMEPDERRADSGAVKDALMALRGSRKS
ncbi:MAG TPA: HEAT repeat domain-containing protein [Polyangiaceae bacterium]|jgi:HEAT repeat protein|nr:HEAT repeat domain-containing protein [Polyangiaceae bacterium]